MRNLRGGLSEEGDRDERVKKREEFQGNGVLPAFLHVDSLMMHG